MLDVSPSSNTFHSSCLPNCSLPALELSLSQQVIVLLGFFQQLVCSNMLDAPRAHKTPKHSPGGFPD